MIRGQIGTGVSALFALAVVAAGTPVGAQQRSGINSPNGARSVPATADSLRVLQQLFSEHGRAVSTLGSFIIRYSTTIVDIQPCRMTVAQHDESSVSDGDDTLQLDFSRLTPNPKIVVANDASDLWYANLEPSTGDREIPAQRHTRYKNPTPGSRERFDTTMMFPQAPLIVQTRTRAERVGQLAGTIARLCGGKPMDPRLVAERNRPRDVSGNLLSDSSIVRVKAQCRALVRENLVSPTTAQFSSDSLMDANVVTGIMHVHGKVAAQNKVGGTLEKTFYCNFKREGDAWIPDGRPLIF